jgi:hypothetical protein
MNAYTSRLPHHPGRAYTPFRFLPFYRDAFRAIVLRKSPDEVAQMHGWRFHTDGVHLNSRSGVIVAELVQAFRRNCSLTDETVSYGRLLPEVVST